MSFRILTTVLLLLNPFNVLAAIPITGKLAESLDEQYLTYSRSISSFPDIILERNSSYQISIEQLNSSGQSSRLKIYLCNVSLDSCESLDKSELEIKGSILSKRYIYCTVPLNKISSGMHNFAFQLSVVEITP